VRYEAHAYVRDVSAISPRVVSLDGNALGELDDRHNPRLCCSSSTGLVGTRGLGSTRLRRSWARGWSRPRPTKRSNWSRRPAFCRRFRRLEKACKRRGHRSRNLLSGAVAPSRPLIAPFARAALRRPALADPREARTRSARLTTQRTGLQPARGPLGSAACGMSSRPRPTVPRCGVSSACWRSWRCFASSSGGAASSRAAAFVVTRRTLGQPARYHRGL